MPETANFSSLPERLLDLDLREAEARPRYLTPRARPWLQELLDRVRACQERPRDEVKRRLSRPPHMGERGLAWRAMGHLLAGAAGFRVDSAASPRELRADLFLRAARAPRETGREALLEQTAAALAVTPEQVEAGLYADLPQRRVLRGVQQWPPLDQLVERYNLCLVQGLLTRSQQLVVTLDGMASAVLRTARLRQLLCQITRAPDGRVKLELTGPISLFHQTRKYGFAMASWLPALLHAPRWSLDARVSLRDGAHTFHACQDDPLGPPPPPPRRFDSLVERRFFRDLGKLDSPWQVLRDADPVQVGPHLAFPDFTLVDTARGLRIPVEIVGFWTPDYLRRKQQIVAALPAEQRWCLLVDRKLAASEQWTLPPDDLFLFSKRIDAAAFLAFLEEQVAAKFPSRTEHES